MMGRRKMKRMNDDFLFYRQDGTAVYLDDEGNYYVMDNGKKIVFATEEELKDYFEDVEL